MKLFIS